MLLLDDVRRVTAAGLRRSLGYLPDVVVGSPPCQDFSAANTTKAGGIDGERGRLFLEAVRLVGECRPRWFAFENSPRLRRLGADRVLGELETHGYAAWPLVVGAVHAAAPHRRQRVFLAGIRGDLVERAANDNRPAAAADTDRQPLRVERERIAGRWPGGLWPPGQGEPANDGGAAPPDTDQGGLTAGRLAQRAGLEGQAGAIPLGSGADGCELGPSRAGANAAGARPPQHAGASQADELPAALGVDWLDAWAQWNGGSARHFRMAHGVPAGLARRCVAAYGDAVVPQAAGLIVRELVALAPSKGRALDLFAGAVGGWWQALAAHGIETVAAVEIDPWRRLVLGRLHRRAWSRPAA